MKTTLAPDRPATPMDARLEEYAQAAALRDQSIKLRIQPDFYDRESGRYMAWTNVSWSLELDNVEEGRRLRQALTALINVFAQGEQAQVKAVMLLENWSRGEVGMPLITPSPEVVATAAMDEEEG